MAGRRHRTRLAIGIGLLAFVMGLAGAAVADSNRSDWPCSGDPYVPCPSAAGTHSWGSASAVNTASPYQKCAKLTAVSFTAGRVCGAGYTIRVQSNTYGLCNYPNNATGSGCGHLDAAVGNDTGTRHGLRGVGYY